jgi:hypothetical protein
MSSSTITTPVKAESIKLRNQLLREIIAETPEEDRGALVTVCINYLPKEMDFLDGIIYVLALSKGGLIDLHNETTHIYFDRCVVQNGHRIIGTFKVDNDGRIFSLSVNHSDPNVLLYDLPPIIGRLERLEYLSLYNCRSVPVELSNLPNLKVLMLDDECFANFPAEMELRHLKELHVGVVNYEYESASPPFFAWLKGQLSLPSLEKLEFDNLNDKFRVHIVDFLLTNDFCFQDTLKHIGITACNLNDTEFQTIYFEIMPKFQKVSSLNLSSTKIQTIKPIVDRMKNDTLFLPSKALRILDVGDTPLCYKFNSSWDKDLRIHKKMSDDPKENAAMVELLETCNNIVGIGGHRNDYGADIEYALKINQAGRSIVGKGCGSDSRKTVPLSLWPTILERAYEKSDCMDYYHAKKKNATGFYYLLREGPVLVGRSHIFGSAETVGLEDENHSDGKDDDDAIAAKGNQTLKRKASNEIIDNKLSDTRNENSAKSSSSPPRPLKCSFRG